MREISVACSGILSAGNLGALARLCDNFNAKHLIACNPRCALTQEAYHRATHGKKFLDRIKIESSITDIRKYSDLIIGLSSRIGSIDNLSRPAISIQELAESISSKDGSIAILLGSEDHGLDNKEVSQCDLLVHIPLASGNDVLNISHAAAIALWEISKSSYSSMEEKKVRIMLRKEREYFLGYLKKILEYSWLPEEKYESTLKVFRSIIARSMVTHRESPALVGTMRMINKAFENGPPPNKVNKNEKEGT